MDAYHRVKDPNYYESIFVIFAFEISLEVRAEAQWKQGKPVLPLLVPPLFCR